MSERIFGRLRRYSSFFAKAAGGLEKNQSDINNRCAKNCSERYDETNFAVMVVCVQPADADEIRSQQFASQGYHQRRNGVFPRFARHRRVS